MVGDAAFERGARLLAEGRVGDLNVDGERASATLRDSPPRKTTVRRTPRGFDGACDCPESDGFDFCVHCVAVALAFDQRNAERRRAAAGSPSDRLRVYLKDQSVEHLVDLLIKATEQTPALREQLQLKSDLASGKLDLRALKKQVTAALPLRDVWQQTKVRAYFSHAVSSLTGLLDIADAMPADSLMTVSEYAIERLVRVLERVDDSNGHRWFVQDRIRELYAAALARSEMSGAQRAAHLLRHILKDPTDAFSGGPQEFAEALGETGMQAFFEQVRATLDDAKTEPIDQLRLRTLLRERAEADGDIDALIALQREACHSAHDHYRLAELYLDASDPDAALEALSQGDELAGRDRRNLPLRVRVHGARDEWADAVDAQIMELLRAPSEASYDELAALADHLGTRQQTLRQAERQLALQLNAGHNNRGTAARVLARVAWARGERERAFNVAVEHIHDTSALLPMIDGLRDDQPARAAQLFDCAVEAAIKQKRNGAYREAVQLIRDYRDLYDELGPGMFDAFLTDLRERHRAKRNLMMLLDRLVAEGLTGPTP